MKFLRFLAAGLLITASVRAAVPATNDLMLPERLFPDLDAILKKAVQQSPRMLRNALDLETAENNRIQARSNLLPSLSASYRYYKAHDVREDIGNVNATKIAYDLTLSQPIYYWGERHNNARIGEIQAELTKGQYREGYRLFVQELRSAYLRLIAQKIALKRAHFNLELVQSNLQQQEARLAKKVISEAEMATARLNAEQAQINVERVDFDFQNAKDSFGRLTGMPVMADEAIPEAIPEVNYSPEPIKQLLAGFLSQKDPPTAEASNLRKSLAIENLNYASAKTRLYPKFNAIVSTNQDQQTYTVNVAQKYQVTSYFAGITANWLIFDGYTAGALVRNSLIRRRQLESDYKQMTERLAIDAQNDVKQIEFSVRSMSIFDRFVAGGESNLKAMREDHARGVKAEADVNQAQLALYDAQVGAANARSDFLWRIGDFLGLVVEDPALANLPTP